jgi:hypothetical protein
MSCLSRIVTSLRIALRAAMLVRAAFAIMAGMAAGRAPAQNTAPAFAEMSPFDLELLRVIVQSPATLERSLVWKMPLHKLLPIPPRLKAPIGPVLVDDLAQVPEVAFGAAPDRDLPIDQAVEELTIQVKKIKYVNEKRRDAFIESLVSNRAELAGLAFLTGDDCRMDGERLRQFQAALALIKAADGRRIADAAAALPGGRHLTLTALSDEAGQEPPPKTFWESFGEKCAIADKETENADKAVWEHVVLARIAALMQVFGADTAPLRRGLAQYLSTVAHPEASRALAQLALFSADAEVRATAIAALQTRRGKDYTPLMIAGLRYPWPAVAKRSAEALIKLDRQDALPQLLDLLEMSDPRMPMPQEVNGKKVQVVRELVKLNHHRNCLLCHPPLHFEQHPFAGSPNQRTFAIPFGGIPIPGEPLASGYEGSSKDHFVRVDTTYLRQDFSMMLPVRDADPWPDMQRFDFLVRARVLSDKEAAVHGANLAKRGPGAVTPYERAILSALRELTGRDTAPSAVAWRTLLGMPSTK